jgi:hypothetical protein
MGNTYDRNNSVSVNYFEPSVGIPNANRPEGVPFGFLFSYATPNANDLATFAEHGRVNEFSASISTPPYNTVAHSVFPTPPQIAKIPYGSYSETHVNDQRVLQVSSTSSQSTAEQHLEPNSSRQLDEKVRSAMETIIAQVRKDVRKKFDACLVSMGRKPVFS